ncbi:unnamed protein product [Rhizophagus irregularis]|nr:unnamed protein product [Rhizophagus irregularis]
MEDDNSIKNSASLLNKMAQSASSVIEAATEIAPWKLLNITNEPLKEIKADQDDFVKYLQEMIAGIKTGVEDIGVNVKEVRDDVNDVGDNVKEPLRLFTVI